MMWTSKKQIVLFSLLLPFTVSATDLTELKKCVSQNYGGLLNRHGIVAAVLDADSSETLIFGNAKPNQIFEIGSITKTFTANLLAQAILSKSIKISDPIPAQYQKQSAIISYQNLTTHTSGLNDVEILKNFKSTNELFPFEGLSVSVLKNLYAKAELTQPPGTTWLYSNMAVSLLGMILSENSNTPYEKMVQDQILKPLGMNDTYFEVPESESSRFPTGFLVGVDGTRHSMPHWDLSPTALDPAGGLRSSIGDLIMYARANFTPESTPLNDSILLAQQPLYSIQKKPVDGHELVYRKRIGSALAQWNHHWV
jgi:CubicO group peptidase (beta-lactamase class C family)